MKMNLRHTNRGIRLSTLFPILTIVGVGLLMLLASSYEPKWLFNWKGIRKEIKESILLVEMHGITSGIGGNGASNQNEVERRNLIMATATTAELTQLLQYPNGSVRATAYEGLLKRDDFGEKADLIFQAINDTSFFISYHSGCFVWNRGIREYIVHDVLMMDNQVPPMAMNSMNRVELTQTDIDKILVAFRKRQKNHQ